MSKTQPDFLECPSKKEVERATVALCVGVSIVGYRMPDGEFRVSVTEASTLAGFKKNWLRTILETGGNPLKSLQQLGFSGQMFGPTNQTPDTISLKDFQRLLLYGVKLNKSKSIAIQLAFVDGSMSTLFRDAFGLRALPDRTPAKKYVQIFPYLSVDMIDKLGRESVVRDAQMSPLFRRAVTRYIEQDYPPPTKSSGPFQAYNLRITPEQYRELKSRAKLQGVQLSWICNDIIRRIRPTEKAK